MLVLLCGLAAATRARARACALSLCLSFSPSLSRALSLCVPGSRKCHGHKRRDVCLCS